MSRLQEKELAAGSFRHRFEHTWQPEGGLLHLLLPLSFDLVDPSNFVNKAIGWTDRIRPLRKSAPDFRAFLLVGKQSEQTREPAYAEAKGLLESDAGPGQEIVPEEQASAFAEVFSRKRDFSQLKSMVAAKCWTPSDSQTLESVQKLPGRPAALRSLCCG